MLHLVCCKHLIFALDTAVNKTLGNVVCLLGRQAYKFKKIGLPSKTFVAVPREKIVNVTEGTENEWKIVRWEMNAVAEQISAVISYEDTQ